MKRLLNKVADYILIGITIFLAIFIISIIVAAAITGLQCGIPIQALHTQHSLRP